MNFPVRALAAEELPAGLREIPQPPTQLYLRGTLPSPNLKLLTVVGSRKYTTYGKQVVDHLIGGLSDFPIAIISGLALGIDSLAHEAALRAKLYTCAIPGSGVDDSVLYPVRHRPLARKILESGGGLLSEFEPTFRATKWSFAQRDRIMAGISHATLLIEAGEKSGTLITARMATDYNRELLVVPGSIFSKNSVGTHQFLKLGAVPVTSSEDILLALGIEPDAVTQPLTASLEHLSDTERLIIKALYEPKERDTLIRTLNLPAHEANAILMHMEMLGLIASEHNVYRAII